MPNYKISWLIFEPGSEPTSRETFQEFRTPEELIRGLIAFNAMGSGVRRSPLVVKHYAQQPIKLSYHPTGFSPDTYLVVTNIIELSADDRPRWWRCDMCEGVIDRGPDGLKQFHCSCGHTHDLTLG